MATRHDLIKIDFQASTGKVTPAMEALRKAAEKANKEVAKLNKQLTDGKAAGMAEEQISKLEQKLAEAEKRIKSYNKAENELIKGVGTLDKAIKAFNDGTLDKMSAAFNKAAYNAAKLAQQKTTNKKDWEQFAAIMLATEKNVLKANSNMEVFMQTIANGGKVSVKELRDMQNTLKSLSDITEHGSDEWKDYQIRLAAVEKKMREINRLSEDQMKVLAQPKGKSMNELRDAVAKAEAQLAGMRQETDADKKEFSSLSEQVKNAKLQIKELGGESSIAAGRFQKAWDRLKTYIGLYMGAAIVIQKLTATMGDLMELSDKMGEVRKTTGFTAEEVGKLSDELARLDTRTPIQELLGLSAAAGQLGLKARDDVRGFTEAANELIVALPEMGRESATSLMKIANATGDVKRNGGDIQETLERVGSTIISLRANSASAAPAITDFVARVGAVGAQAGITIDQIAAMGSTIDALGGRVEMSATALSRMIPAIRNNMFSVAKAIGMTEADLKKMPAMEQMVTIFRKLRESVKGIDTSTENGQEQLADNVEAVLSTNASMAEVMKELNQQGARAGIVFGLMSQNVDELEKQLEIAGNAYQKNTALMDEYNKMNDTTAARWERLKNQLQEMFVSNDMQQLLGWLIEKLRIVVDWISDQGPIGSFFRWSIVYLGLLKTKWAETFWEATVAVYEHITATNLSTEATIADTAAKEADATATEGVAVASEKGAVATNKFNKALKANVAAVVATAVLFLGIKLLEFVSKAKKATSQVDDLAEAEKRAKEESIKERAELEKLYRVTQDQTKSIDERKKALRDMVGDEKYKQYYENLSTESELATAAAGAYKELTEQIMAAARARVYEQRITELAEKNVSLQDEIDERRKWHGENRANYEREARRSAAVVGTTGYGSYQDRGKFTSEWRESEQKIEKNLKEIAQNEAEIQKLEEKIRKTTSSTTGGSGGGDGGGGDGGNNNTNPYGDYNRVTSEYSEWDADALVARRKEMLVRIRALGNGADVQAVLSQDGRFISEAVRKNIKTTRQAIEWYNSERLKIQEELHSRYLTNSGDWMDAGGNKGGRKKKFDESTYALAELERYYALRKERIEDQRIEEGLSEAEFNKRVETLEQEHLQKRSDLRNSFTSKDQQFVEQFRQWWENVLELDEIAWYKVDNEWMEATERNIGYNNMKVQKDLTKMKGIIMKQMDAIADILSKERPFDGITRNLEDNLTKLGILFTGSEREGGIDNFMGQRTDRLSFLIKEAEHAYSITIDDLLRKMAENGLRSWADEISKSDAMQNALMAQLRSTFDAVQEAIKKEATLIRKQVDIIWNDTTLPNGQSAKQFFESGITRTGQQQGAVSRANSLIGAGRASETVADKLAIKQMQIRFQMQQAYFDMLRKVGMERIEMLEKQGKLEDAEHVRKSLNLTLSQEQKTLDEQRLAIAEKMEESQNKLYTELREWASLFSGSLQSVFEASNTGLADFYNNRARLRLTGETKGPQRYIITNNAGTSGATAHYETLSEMQALERQLEIDQQNAVADAWKKVMDDINTKMNDLITDQINAMLQNASVDANTDALGINTRAILGLTETMGGNVAGSVSSDMSLDGGSVSSGPQKPWGHVDESDQATAAILANQQKIADGEKRTDKAMASNAQSAFAKMTQAANLYGIAYQAMSNDNMSAAQKFGMIAIQSAGNAAITALTTNMSQTVGQTAAQTPSVLSRAYSELGPIGGPIAFALFTGLLGGLMGLAASKVAKSKSEIASVTGARNSVASGRLTTGMLTYAEGNVNEFTDPSSLQAGHTYNVDAADGRQYRARYTGSNPRTHITNGPEFHLAGERGREMIIDANTTRQITMDERGIWKAIQTLSSGGRLRRSSARRGGILGFAEGNLDDFDMTDGLMSGRADMSAVQEALDRNTAIQEALLERLSEPIQAKFDVYGKGGLVDSYDSGKKTVTRYGQPY